MDKGAVISECGTFRYLLWRIWDPSLPIMGVVMVNPSTADAEADDRTIDKVIQIATHNQCGGIWVGNLGALRSTDPSALATAPDPIGPENDRYLQELLGRAALILCAWGANANLLPGRVDAVKALMRAAGVKPWMLKRTQGGHPTHPLARGKGHVPFDIQLVPYVI